MWMLNFHYYIGCLKYAENYLDFFLFEPNDVRCIFVKLQNYSCNAVNFEPIEHLIQPLEIHTVERYSKFVHEQSRKQC